MDWKACFVYRIPRLNAQVPLRVTLEHKLEVVPEYHWVFCIKSKNQKVYNFNQVKKNLLKIMAKVIRRSLKTHRLSTKKENFQVHRQGPIFGVHLCTWMFTVCRIFFIFI